jgi:hypothetical protein
MGRKRWKFSESTNKQAYAIIAVAYWVFFREGSVRAGRWGGFLWVPQVRYFDGCKPHSAPRITAVKITLYLLGVTQLSGRK